MNLPSLSSADAVLIVDVQNDFCPGGALPVAEGDWVVPVLNRWIDAARRGQALIVASRDWHPRNHISFRERGGPWPAHCVQDTPGAAFHPDLRLPLDALTVSKATTADKDSYSDFEDTDLTEMLRQRGVRRLWVGGLALDYCIRATVLDALAAGFEVHLILDATRPINLNPGDDQRALDEMSAHGAVIESGASDA
jgi:nicotinamidase/pyrazinamidase